MLAGRPHPDLSCFGPSSLLELHTAAPKCSFGEQRPRFANTWLSLHVHSHLITEEVLTYAIVSVCQVVLHEKRPSTRHQCDVEQRSAAHLTSTEV